MKKIFLLFVLLCCVLVCGCSSEEEPKISKNYSSDYVILKVPQSNVTVYVTDYGDKYHRRSCGSLYNSKNEINLTEAVIQGYKPCQRCKPKKLRY